MKMLPCAECGLQKGMHEECSQCISRAMSLFYKGARVEAILGTKDFPSQAKPAHGTVTDVVWSSEGGHVIVRWDGYKRFTSSASPTRIKLVPRSFQEHMLGTYRDAWLQKDGSLVMVKSMSNKHLLNTITMLKRWADRAMLAEQLNILICLSGPFAPRGDMAREALESELSSFQTVEQYLKANCPPWENMIHEARCRWPRAIENSAVDDFMDELGNPWGDDWGNS